MRVGFLDLVQWLQVAASIGVLWAFVRFTPIPTKPAVTIGVLIITPLAGLFILGDYTGVSLTAKLKAAVCWRFSKKSLVAGNNPADKRTGITIPDQPASQAPAMNANELLEQT